MRTIAIETSGPLGGVAIGDASGLLASQRFGERLIHARELIPALDRLTARLGWRPAQIDRIAVSIGPGSFTGLRIGLATAKVLARECDAQLIGVDSLDVLAAGVSTDGEGGFAIVMDARRETVHARRYVIGGCPPTPDGPRRSLSPAELASELPADLPLLGTGVAAYRAAWPDQPELALAAPDPALLLALVDQGAELDPLHAVPDYGMCGVRPTRRA